MERSFLKYYQSRPKENTERVSSISSKSQELISKIKRKRQELREISNQQSMLNEQSEFKLATSNLDKTQIKDLKRADNILRGSANLNRSVFVQKRDSEILLTDGTSETELIHGPRQTLKQDNIRWITRAALHHVRKSKDSILSDFNIDKYKNKLKDCELSLQDIEIYKKRAARLGITQPLQKKANTAIKDKCKENDWEENVRMIVRVRVCFYE